MSGTLYHQWYLRWYLVAHVGPQIPAIWQQDWQRYATSSSRMLGSAGRISACSFYALEKVPNASYWCCVESSPITTGSCVCHHHHLLPVVHLISGPCEVYGWGLKTGLDYVKKFTLSFWMQWNFQEESHSSRPIPIHKICQCRYARAPYILLGGSLKD